MPPTAASVSPSAPAASASPSPAPSAAPAELTAGLLAVTVTTGVRVRSLPAVAEDSIKYTPLLPEGASLLVTAGPVVASGYTWIQVAPLAPKLAGGVDRGWVAVADHDGTPWVAVAPDPTPGYELANTSATRSTGSLAAAKLEASQANAFGLALYRQLLSSGTVASARGMVFSPTSIVDALAMARAGANGETATQMDAVLHANGWDQLSGGISSLDAQLLSRDSTWTDDEGKIHTLSLRLANTAFVQRGFPIEDTYLTRLGKTFGAGIALVDFEANTKGAIGAINGWVNRQTIGRIPVIVDDTTITEQTRLALVNAIYLKANWAREFSPGQTTTASFSLFGGGTAKVQMMHQYGGQSMVLATGSGWRATELSYLGGDGTPLAITLVLPDNLRTFERGLSVKTIATVQATIASERARLQDVKYTGATDEMDCGTYPYEVLLGLPRFGVETQAKLSKLLGAMGMPLAITAGAADFTGINPDAGLYIGEVIHVANIDVDEKGTTAAAATVVGVDTGGCTGPIPAKTVRLTFNHPFLFYIRDVKTGAILFIGRVTDPSKR